MNKKGAYIGAVVIVIGLGAYLIWTSRNSGAVATVPPPVIDGNTMAASSTATSTAMGATTSTPAGGSNPTSTASGGTYKDGTYDGPVTDAYYGNLQVEAVIQGGKLVDVKALQYPHDQGTSVHINTTALPTLISEAIAAQSANVNVVSGATQSSGAFQQSLAAALQSAQS